MGVEFTYLVWAIALTVVQAMVPAMGTILQNGPVKMAGNRHDLPPTHGWTERAQRNMLENMIPFTALVLVAHMTGSLNEATATGAMLFFWARVAFAVVYTVGIPWIRTAIWGVSMVGMLMIFIELI